MSEREVIHWTVDEESCCRPLSCRTEREAIEQWMQDEGLTAPPDVTVELCGYARAAKPAAGPYRDAVVGILIDMLDENYGPIDGETKPSGGMRAAATTFVEAVLSEYTVHACEIVERKAVRVRDYIDVPGAGRSAGARGRNGHA